MKNYLNIRTYLVLFALLLAGLALYYFTHIVEEMEQEERKRVALLVEGIESLATNTESGAVQDVTYTSKVIDGNSSIPLIMTDDNDVVLSFVNLDSNKVVERPKYLSNKLEDFKKQGNVAIIQTPYSQNKVYYGDSTILSELRYYPFVLITIIFVILFILFLVLRYAQKNMEHKLWVGMSKETAHQLGTPLTSIISWMELLKDTGANKEWLDEMEKDVIRLQLIADRFSKIGSAPVLEEENVQEQLEFMTDYMQKRSPARVQISFTYNSKEVYTALSAPLFNWVIENLIRNALDAMEGKGEIHIHLENSERMIIIDICDTGKGIPRSNFKKVFEPGYSTKKRGWGLGLSLAKRIIQEYHDGDLFVKKSEIGKGTTFRIILRR